MRASPVLKAVVLASSARLHSGTTTTVPAAATALSPPSSSSSPIMARCRFSSRFFATNTAKTIFGTRTMTRLSYLLSPAQVVPRQRAGDFSSSGGGGGRCGGRIRPLAFLSAPPTSSLGRPSSRWSIPSVPSIATKKINNRRQQRLLLPMRQNLFHREQQEETTAAMPFTTASPPANAGASSRERRRWQRRQWRHRSGYRGMGPLAMSTVTEKDVMREFATAAAEEAGLRKKNKNNLPSDEMRQEERRRRQGSPAAAVNGEAPEGGTAVDSARPTGYKYGDVLTDTDGLPLVYDSDSIGRYWDKRPGELNSRWTRFLSVTVPFATRVVKDYTGGNIMKNEAELARDLRIVIEKLGPTFIKLGQALSIRPDVIGPAATEELAKLQDAVPPFATPLALEVLEQELGRPPSEVFSELSEEPIAAASLAQVYRGVLRSDGRAVAVKIQRPGLVQEVTKDLYVLKRAVGVYQRLSDRWTAQMTDYNELLRVWATGFYQELDFLNEANNQIRMKKVLKSMEGQVFVPDVVLELSTRTVLVSEWVEGVKLTKAEPSVIRELTSIAQEAFLVQLLGEGFMHCDPHPGNMMLVDESMRAERGRLALLDFGLMAELGVREREGMVSALIHTANRDYKSLIEDLVTLEVLPSNTDRGQVEPVMKRVIGPYVFEGGGAKSLNYQSLAKDLARATLEIPFNIPPYFALIARALGILEGVALTGDPDYRIVMEAYPFVTRKIISDDSPALQRALRDILYSEDGKFMAKRLSVLLSYATGVVAADSAVFVDFDTLPSTAASLSQTLKFLLADEARPLRAALVGEASNAADLVLRRATRQAVVRARDLLRPPPPPFPFLPRLPALPLPIPDSVVDAMSPRLTPEEDIFLASLEELAYALAGLEQGAVSDDPIGMVRKLLQPGNDGAAGELAEFVQGLPADSQQTGALLEVGSEVVQNLAERASERFNGLLSRGNAEERRRGEDSGGTVSSTGGSESRR